ncbi:GNAT family N-acetyltransferase [Silanimonas sp.]|uniref:GNAT family N-acetyltransferase n=1 Tax=Silanimonas sp. TaxID=1929290 RepID=UPI001BC5BE09|nr:GNAT family N-acetyltransferase [Silanimonas sp.]MBS3896262.1 GNAT family N-acetyltransferase [Silanimonas sp.]
MPELRLHRRLEELPAAAWDALNRDGHPFTAHAFLSGLEAHGCLDPEYGWTPLHAALWEGDALLAAAPAYAKGNSHGEFVFDQAWANAYAQYGLDYYPKWLIGVPYTPVTGPRLLACEPAHKRLLLDAMREAAPRLGLQSLHANFLDEEDLAAFDGSWLAREDLQFHWRRDPAWQGFDDFLGALDHKRRKNLKADRRKVVEAGVTLRIVEGEQACGAPLAAMHRFYRQTFAEKWNHAAMTEAFFQHLGRAMPDAVVLVLAERAAGARGEPPAPIAGALCLRSGKALYGRYWGASQEVPGLHFEACYHQGIAHCIERGIDRFEPGAQGVHKLARGFLPAIMHSRHWLVEPRFHAALERWCMAEREAVQRQRAAFAAHSPFRAGDSP